jgi:cytochrome P450
VPFDGKQCVRDTVLPNGSNIKAGQFVMYAIYALGRDTTRWGEDALLFKPERFMTSRRRNAFEYPVFNVSSVLSQHEFGVLLLVLWVID